MKIYPYYPKPIKSKLSLLMALFKKDRSLFDVVFEKSYTMKMGALKLPGLSIYVPNDPDLIQQIMISEAKDFPKSGLIHQMLEPLLGESIFTTNGIVWKKQRELLNPSFEMVRISHVFDLMHDAAMDMSERLKSYANGAYYDIDKEMTFVTADIIFRTIMSEKLGEAESDKIVGAFESFQELSTKLGMQKMFLIAELVKMFGSDKRRLQMGNVIRNALGDIIKPRYDAAAKGTPGEYRDILASLLKVVDEETGKPFSYKEILDQIAMLFLAGHETSASALTWTLYLLSLYPEEQDKAYREIREVCGDGEFTVENIKALTFVTNVFKEAIRLYPPVSFMPREATEDITMRGKQIKKGDTIVVSSWLMHRNERFWKDAHMFNPRRFDDPKKIVKNTYFPFGLGPRTCIGAGFAMQEAVLLLAVLLRDYRCELQPGFTPKIVGRLTTRSLNGMPIKLIPRT